MADELTEAREVPRHILIALFSLQRAFERRDSSGLGTINEYVQPVADAAMAWIGGLRRERDDFRSRADAERARWAPISERAELAERERDALATDLAWHEDRHGTRAEQEAEEENMAAELAAIEAMSDEEVNASLVAAGVDVEAGRKKSEAMIRVCVERLALTVKVEKLEAEVARLKAGGCARDQRLTQFCGEAAAAYSQLAALRIEHEAQAALLDATRVDRDAARLAAWNARPGRGA